MTRRNAGKTRKRPKYDTAQHLKYWILPPKKSKLLQPIAWIEDEDGETVPVAYTVEEMQSYRAFPPLYNERLFVSRLVSCQKALHSTNCTYPCQVGPAFKFLELPTEIRIMIYCHTLRCYHPIKPRETDLRIDKRDSIEINLLRTCQQIHREGSEVFFGESQFELWHGCSCAFLTDLLPQWNVD